MHDPLGVRAGQAEQRTLEHDQRRLRAGGAVLGEDAAERHAVHQLHHDGGVAVRGLHVFVEFDDVGVLEFHHQPGFALEARQEFRVGAQPLAQILDRHERASGLIGRQYDPSTSPDAEFPYFPISGNSPLAHRNSPLLRHSARRTI
jgi:hypothetical protein